MWCQGQLLKPDHYKEGEINPTSALVLSGAVKREEAKWFNRNLEIRRNLSRP